MGTLGRHAIGQNPELLGAPPLVLQVVGVQPQWPAGVLWQQPSVGWIQFCNCPNKNWPHTTGKPRGPNAPSYIKAMQRAWGPVPPTNRAGVAATMSCRVAK